MMTMTMTHRLRFVFWWDLWSHQSARMMIFVPAIPLLILLLWIPPSSSSSTSECSLYLAKSSIPNAGRGVFAARDFRLGDKIGTPSIGIPFLDLPADANATVFGALQEFLWESADIGGFGEARRVDLFIPGPASLINHHAALENVIAGGLTLEDHGEGAFSRSNNPMAGSNSLYHQFHLIAKRDIQAGEELFVDHHQTWNNHPPSSSSSSVSSSISMESKRGTIPTADDYEWVEKLVRAIDEGGLLLDRTDAECTDVLYRFQTEILTVGSPSQEALTRREQVLQQLWPRSKHALQQAVELGIAQRLLRPRSLDWIRRHGQCLDHISTGPSNALPEAGQGAFATRAIETGSIISSSPMVTITNGASAMKLTTIGNATQQLLVNYCFGHGQSVILLCPTTQAALINHDSKAPNVGIRWAAPNDGDGDDDWTVESLAALTVNETQLTSYNARQVLEYIALRPIDAGEELWMDYTSGWETALSSHLEHGHSSTRADQSHVSARTLREEKRLIVESVDSNHTYMCQIYPNAKIMMNVDSWEEFSSNKAINRRDWSDKLRAWYHDNAFVSLYPCLVVHADHTRDMYDVEMLVKTLGFIHHVGRRYRNVPGHRIEYADRMYQSDMHLEWAFRQFIPIHDSIFPLRWRQDYKPASDWKLGILADVPQTKAMEDEYEEALRNAKCGTYLAKSNVPNAGFGTYTAIDIPASGLMISSTMSVIPATNHGAHHWVGNDYVWSGSSFHFADMEGYPIPQLAVSMVAGLFGALANDHTGITNLKQDAGTWEPTLDRTKDLGAGAFSDYINFGFKSMYPIAAGEELFVSYGEHWFLDRSEFAEVPLRKNFAEANAILASVLSLVGSDGQSVDEGSLPKLLHIIQENVLDKTDVRTKTALKVVNTSEDLHHVLQRNGTAESSVEVRSQEWLEENGYCQDHIFTKTSTIPQAGKGAFARRLLPKGSLVMTAPTVATRRDMLQLNLTEIGAPVNEFQLMLNYHFGHPDSNILFFPLNHLQSINHKSQRGIEGKEPNARVEFSTTEKRSLYFKALPLVDLQKQKKATMVLDVVATRDILPDEEVFIDYGQAWENAWQEYSDNWKSPCSSFSVSCFESSKQVKQMNQNKFNRKYHEWSDIHLSICHLNRTLIETNGEHFYIVRKVPDSFEQPVNPKVKLEYEGIDYGHEGFSIPNYVSQKTKFQGKPCKILDGVEGAGTFDVVFFAGQNKDIPESHLAIRVRNLPQQSVLFHHKGLKSDMMVPGTFRHEIAIPDEDFPSLWKDRLYQ